MKRRFNPGISGIAREQIGIAIAHRVMEVGYTLERLATESTLTENQVTKIITGQPGYSIDHLLAVCGVLRMKIDFYGAIL